MKKRIVALFWFSTFILAVCIFMGLRQGESEAGTNIFYVAEQSAGKHTEQEILTLQKEQEGLYAYECLNEEEQEIYAQIYDSLIKMQEIELSSTDTDLIEKVFQCVLNDHPEIFYVEGYTFTKYTRGKKITKIIFQASYTMEKEEIVEKREAINQRITEILSEIPQNSDDYGKIKYIYEYIIKNTEYNVAAENNQNICSVFLDGQSVCQGYAKATQYLLSEAGIKSTMVVGYVEFGEGHAWNLVYADGKPYYVDTTWGDASYRMTAEENYEVNTLPNINYDYLCVTTEQLCKTHRIDNVVPMPECTDVEDNYYVREGAYFTEYNEEQLLQFFEKSYAEGKEYITLQCADGEVYEIMNEELITRQKIFMYMDASDGVIAYSQNEEQYSLSFWLSE
ncbi:MAG: hypothetical protein IJN54_03800 [Lachnospiraceae bacterium]|nr:hypothetical protein [Lachnospiraceae bacterium]